MLIEAPGLHSRKTFWCYSCVAFTAALATVAILWMTPHGAGVSPDSIVYIERAEDLLAGQGFADQGQPIAHFPPLYPMVLAAAGYLSPDLVQAARFLGALLFGTSTALVSLAVCWGTARDLGATAAAGLLMISSPPLLDVHAMALSEPLFIALCLGALIFLARYCSSDSLPALVASSLLLGLSAIARYVGISFFAAALALVLVRQWGQCHRRRLGHCAVFLVVSITPLLLVLTRNLAVSGSATNRVLAVHLVSRTHIKQLVATLYDYFLPIPISNWTKAITLCLAALGAILAAGVLRRNLDRDWRNSISLYLFISSLLFLIYYLFSLFVSISLFDAHTPLDFRLLCPVYILSIIGSFTGTWAVAQTLGRRVIWLHLFFFAAISFAVKAPAAASWAVAIRQNGQGFTSQAWRESQILAYIRSLPEGTTIYSNGSDVIRFLTAREAIPIPQHTSANTRLPSSGYAQSISAMCRDMVDNGSMLIYLDRITWRWYLPTQETLQSACALSVLSRVEDGTVYVKK